MLNFQMVKELLILLDNPGTSRKRWLKHFFSFFFFFLDFFFFILLLKRGGSESAGWKKLKVHNILADRGPLTRINQEEKR